MIVCQCGEPIHWKEGDEVEGHTVVGDGLVIDESHKDSEGRVVCERCYADQVPMR